MKNLTAIRIAIFACVSLGLACGSSTGSNSGSGTPQSTPIVPMTLDKSVVDEVTGIPECDEVLKLIADEAAISTSGDATTTSKTEFLNKIRTGITRSVSERKGDKAEIGKNCKGFKLQIERYKMMEGEKKR